MKNYLSLLSRLTILTIILYSCTKEQTLTPNGSAGPLNQGGVVKDTTNNGSGGGSGDGSGGGGIDQNVFRLLAADGIGDAGGGLDASQIEFKYDPAADELAFRITALNLSSFASSPSVDLSFQLPNGTDSNDLPGTPFRGNTLTHRTAAVYADAGGAPPTSYTFLNVAGFARNSIVLTSDNFDQISPICATGNNCVDIVVDVPNNTITCTMDRKSIISDTEVGSSKTAKIQLVANVGFEIQNNDLITDGTEFSITIN